MFLCVLMCSLFSRVCANCACARARSLHETNSEDLSQTSKLQDSHPTDLRTSHVSIVSKYSVPPLKRSNFKQTSKWMLWAVDANKARLYLNCEPDLLTCASLNCGIYKSAQNKHLHCITSKRRLRVWKKKKPQIWQEDCNQIHSMAMAHHKNVEFSESFVATGVNGVPKPESCTHILHRLMKLTLQGLAW